MIQSAVEIINGAVLSDTIATNGQFLARIETPTTLTSTTLTVEVSLDGSTYRQAADQAGTLFVINSPANKSISLPKEITYGARAIRFRVGSAEAAARTFLITLGRV